MIGEPQLYWLLLASALIHLLAIRPLAGIVGDDGASLSAEGVVADSRDERDPSDLVNAEDGVVVCPDCEATNELGYRFCRRCVGELPGADGRIRTARRPAGRSVL